MPHRWRRRRSWWHLPSVWHIWALVAQCWEIRGVCPSNGFPNMGAFGSISKIWIWTSRSLKISKNIDQLSNLWQWVQQNKKIFRKIKYSHWKRFHKLGQFQRETNVKVRMRSKNQLVFSIQIHLFIHKWPSHHSTYRIPLDLHKAIGFSKFHTLHIPSLWVGPYCRQRMLDSHDSHVQLPQDASNFMTRRPGGKKVGPLAGGHYIWQKTQTMHYFRGNSLEVTIHLSI